MTTRLRAEPVGKMSARHGESPLWHQVDRRLDWTDIPAGRLHRYDPASGNDEVIEVGIALGSFAPRTRGGYVVAVDAGFAVLDPVTGEVDIVAPIPECSEGLVRMNDGKCDRAGRFWAGSISLDLSQERGALYRLDADHSVHRVVDAVTISNGLDWSLDDKTLYYTDTQALYMGVTAGIDAFDYDAATGAIKNRRRIIDIPNRADGPPGFAGPDGMTVDLAGFIWVAVWGSGEVRRFSPDGQLDTVVELGVPCPTSVAFGGDNLTDLYITTMTLEEAVPVEYRVEHPAYRLPHQGSLFRCRPGIAGIPPRAFAG